MKKVVFIIICISFVICGCSLKPEVVKESEVRDSIDFKVEYEGYNNSNYVLNINNENPFKYLTLDNFNEVFDSTSILFIGRPDVDLSRYVVDNLINISNSYDDVSIYYFNYLDNEPKYEVLDNDIKKIKEQSELYNLMVDKFDKYVSKLTIEIDGKLYKTVDDTFSVPTLVFIIDGKTYEYYDDFEFAEDNNKIVLDDLYLSLVQKQFDKIYK